MFPDDKKKTDMHALKDMMKEYLNGKTIFQEVNRFIKVLAKENPNWINIRKVSNPEFESMRNGQKEVKYDTSITISRPVFKRGGGGGRNAHHLLQQQYQSITFQEDLFGLNI